MKSYLNLSLSPSVVPQHWTGADEAKQNVAMQKEKKEWLKKLTKLATCVSW